MATKWSGGAGANHVKCLNVGGESATDGGCREEGAYVVFCYGAIIVA